MDSLVVVSTQLLFLLDAPAPQRLRDIPIFVLAADHEADLTRRICGNSCVGILNGGKDLLAGFLQICDQGEVEPLIFRCKLV